MSFFTSLIYYRPCQPPAMAARDLAQFIASIRDSGVVSEDRSSSLKVKFGNSIDQDQNGTSWEVEIAPRIFTTHSIEWDIELIRPAGLQNVIDALTLDNRQIYRAFVSLGMPIGSVLQPITRQNSPENNRDFCPDSLSIEIGPIETYDLGSEGAALVGWVGVALSGYGYLFPWKFRDVVDRLNSSPEVQRIASLCRSTWPVSLEVPESRIVEVRKEMGTLWPYDDFDKPWDWYWGVQESG